MIRDLYVESYSIDSTSLLEKLQYQLRFRPLYNEMDNFIISMSTYNLSVIITVHEQVLVYTRMYLEYLLQVCK